jgi:glycosyltransferase involved in cell wall biosynthesis
MHLQELQTSYPAQVDFSRVEKIVFISPHVMREAIATFAIPPEKCIVIPISVRLSPGAPWTPREIEARRDTLGMVGLTPWRKRPDKALALLRTLRARYPNLTLHLKGHTPSEYAWMANRTEELAAYRAFFREVAALERDGIIRFSGYDDDLESFSRGVGWILSLSDFEGCHTAVAEGGVMGCLPLMLNWAGANEVYPAELVQLDNGELERYFDSHYISFENDSKNLQIRFNRSFGIEEVMRQWRVLFRGAIGLAPGTARARDDVALF